MSDNDKAREAWCRACQQRVTLIRMGSAEVQSCPRVSRSQPMQFSDNKRAYGCDLETGGER